MCGGKAVDGPGNFVEPTLIVAQKEWEIVQSETFAPILYIIPFKTLDEAIELHNGVVQGLSSAIFTDNLQHAERFLSAAGSDCGIANVNIGTSGRRDRRRLWRRKGNRRRSRSGLRQLEGLHAAADQHDQLGQ